MRTRLLLLLILFLAFELRFFKISTNPPSLYWDEVAMAYNVQSILDTGADEYGHKFPFFFESFQDYKLPGYIYSLAFVARFFGLNELTVRLPAILYGTGTVAFIFLLADRLFNKRAALLSAYSLAISPWHIQFTRAGFEASGALAFLILGLYLLHKGLDNKNYFFIGLISLILSLCFYNGVRIVVPGMFIYFCIFYWKKMHFVKKDVLIFIIISLFITLPVVLKFLSPQAFIRYSYISIFSNSPHLEEAARLRLSEGNTLLSRLIHHRYLVYSEDFLQNYLSYFSPAFLFFGQDQNQRHFVPNVGLMHLWRLPFIIIGIIMATKKRHPGLIMLFPLLLLSPIAAAVTIPSPHALRALSMLPAILIFSAYAVTFILSKVNKTKLAVILILVSISFLGLNQYLYELHLHYPIIASRDWAYGYKQVFEKIKVMEKDYNSFYITGSYWRPYIFALYYLYYPPSIYQKHPSHNQISKLYFGFPGYDSSDPFYDYEFMKKKLPDLKTDPRTLRIIAPEEKKSNDKVIDTINDLRGNPLFLFVKI